MEVLLGPASLTRSGHPDRPRHGREARTPPALVARRRSAGEGPHPDLRDLVLIRLRAERQGSVEIPKTRPPP